MNKQRRKNAKNKRLSFERVNYVSYKNSVLGNSNKPLTEDRASENTDIAQTKSIYSGDTDVECTFCTFCKSSF